MTLIALPFSTVTRIAHVSGQSCGQTARATWVAAFIVLNAEMGVRKFYVDAPNKAFISQRFWMICAAVEWKGAGCRRRKADHMTALVDTLRRRNCVLIEDTINKQLNRRR
ncbi:hypothetical protein KDX14_08625 [Burkholderia cenocepacia]|uniref:hypothetical protein n=1 Tax=Burkholderia cenocepacia TaxID=95486 RepID=UPI001B8FF05D|nr:hypothetical protein [Burkholderia cenocepacia]MBR8069573.1 hypothetical protein [Burkholderia cenocepacia]